jgi:hypothetical protein
MDSKAFSDDDHEDAAAILRKAYPEWPEDKIQRVMGNLAVLCVANEVQVRSEADIARKYVTGGVALVLESF